MEKLRKEDLEKTGHEETDLIDKAENDISEYQSQTHQLSVPEDELESASKMLKDSEILSEGHAKLLTRGIPEYIHSQGWKLIYSKKKHGSSFNT